MTLTIDPEEARNSGIREDGQQNKYVVLSDEERAKGFVRPVRRTYKHVGVRPEYSTRDLTREERAIYDEYHYLSYEPYPCSVVIDAAAPVPTCGYPSDDERHVEGAAFLHKFASANKASGHNPSSVIGRFWTAAQLASGCGSVTTMAPEIAETYARNPGFYGGTFCAGCHKHLPVGEGGEFVWVDDGTRVGS